VHPEVHSCLVSPRTKLLTTYRLRQRLCTRLDPTDSRREYECAGIALPLADDYIIVSAGVLSIESLHGGVAGRRGESKCACSDVTSPPRRVHSCLLHVPMTFVSSTVLTECESPIDTYCIWKESPTIKRRTTATERKQRWNEMSDAQGNGTWLRLCADLIDALLIQHGRLDNRFERLRDLYQRCVLTSLPNNARVTDDTARRAQLTAFHELVRDSIRHLQSGWPTATKAEIRETVASANNTNADARSGAINVPDLGSVNTAIDTALCLWLGLDCVNEHHLGATLWPATETVERFVLKRRFDVAVEADPRDDVKYFPQDFRAAYLEEISGIRIEQTYYLDQHLRFNEETRTVKIFMDIGWLKAMIRLFQRVIDTPNGSDGNASPANIFGGQASAGRQQDFQVDGQIRAESQSQGVTSNASSAATPSLPTGNK
jgi:hypothetical protein